MTFHPRITARTMISRPFRLGDGVQWCEFVFGQCHMDCFNGELEKARAKTEYRVPIILIWRSKKCLLQPLSSATTSEKYLYTKVACHCLGAVSGPHIDISGHHAVTRSAQRKPSVYNMKAQASSGGGQWDRPHTLLPMPGILLMLRGALCLFMFATSYDLILYNLCRSDGN